MTRALHNFLIWEGKVIAEVVLHSRGVWGHEPKESLSILGVLRHILVHSEPYKETHRAS